MTVGIKLSGEVGEPPAYFSDGSLYGLVSANFTRQSPLPTNPLTVCIKVAIKLGAVTLDAWLGLQDDCCFWHQNDPPSAAPRTVHAARCVTAVNKAIPTDVPPKFILAPEADAADVPP